MTNSDDVEMITITTKEYNKLKESLLILSHLESRGVDNWEGYEYPYCSNCEELKEGESVWTGYTDKYYCYDCIKKENINEG